MTEPKPGGDGSWWTTLPGVLTALAALLTAVGGLVAALHQAGLLPSSSSPPSTASRNPPASPGRLAPAPVPAPPGALGVAPQVEGVRVRIIAVRRSRDRGATFLDLHYSVTTGSNSSRHDPAHFVRLISDGVSLTPVWASASASDLPSNSRQDILVKFPSPAGAAAIIFRFGEEHHLDLPARVAD